MALDPGDPQLAPHMRGRGAPRAGHARRRPGDVPLRAAQRARPAAQLPAVRLRARAHWPPADVQGRIAPARQPCGLGPSAQIRSCRTPCGTCAAAALRHDLDVHVGS